MEVRSSRDEQREIERRERLEQLAAAARLKANRIIARSRKLIANLRGDLDKHGDPERWKHFGDLLLANIYNAKRSGETVTVIDYFDEAVPEIIIDVEINESLNEAAERYFRKYTKARNGKAVIEERIETALRSIADAESLLPSIDNALNAGDEEYLTSLTAPKRQVTEVKKAKKKDVEIKGVRRFVSSDGYEILVGKAAKDNDHLTFRISNSLDTWLHAADYSGSHVVIRNPNRKEIPQRTLGEAANLAAFYSSARELEKAAVNYTQRKFVSRVKGGVPGLVRLASFRTLMAVPKVPFERDDR